MEEMMDLDQEFRCKAIEAVPAAFRVGVPASGHATDTQGIQGSRP